MMNEPKRKEDGSNTYHRDGTVSYWSVYRQCWERHSLVSDTELAAMSHDERTRVIRHLEKHQ